jgi:ParB family chromosome partitioning protein
VTNAIRLLQLPAPLQEAVASGALSAGHARAILAVHDEPAMLELGRRAVDDALTVRDTERLVQEYAAGTRPRPASGSAAGPTRPARLSPDDEQLRRGFEQALGLPVVLQRRHRGGRLLIDFAGDEDLDALYRRLDGPAL